MPAASALVECVFSETSKILNAS